MLYLMDVPFSVKGKEKVNKKQEEIDFGLIHSGQ